MNGRLVSVFLFAHFQNMLGWLEQTTMVFDSSFENYRLTKITATEIMPIYSHFYAVLP